MPMSPQDMMAAIERNLPARTGKTLAQWVSVVRKDGPRDRTTSTPEGNLAAAGLV